MLSKVSVLNKKLSTFKAIVSSKISCSTFIVKINAFISGLVFFIFLINSNPLPSIKFVSVIIKSGLWKEFSINASFNEFIYFTSYSFSKR